MESVSAPDPPINNTATDSSDHDGNDSLSHFRKTVCLQAWWLIKAEKGLAVAGQDAVRVFSSAPILKRYDVFTLETADGICVYLNGFIDKVRTIENGFPSEVLNHFMLGFPSYWKEYAENYLGGGFDNEEIPRSVDDFSEGSARRDKKATSEERHDTETRQEHSCGNITCQAGGESMKANMVLRSSSKLAEAKQNDDLQIAISKKENNAKKASKSGKTIKRKLAYDTEYAENYLGGGINNEEIPRSTFDRDKLSKDSGVDDFSEGTASRNKKATSGERHDTETRQEQSSGNITCQAGGQSMNTNMVLRSSTRLGEAKQNDDLQISVSKKENNAKKASKSGKTIKRKLAYDTESRKTPGITKKTSFVSPESLSCKRSRSGRRLLPVLEFWRNQTAIKNVDGQITGIQDGVHGVEQSRESRSEPQRKRRKQLP